LSIFANVAQASSLSSSNSGSKSFSS